MESETNVFCGRGKIVAVAELDSNTPFKLQRPLHKDCPFAVKLK